MIIVEIETGKVAGKFPRRALTHVLEWWQKYRGELLENWQLASNKQVLKRIKPLE